jgi:hypothetical protein
VESSQRTIQRGDRARDLLAHAKYFRDFVKAVLPGTSVSGLRSQLVAAYLDTALEHYSALILLFENSLNGSAFALLRPIFETTARGLWCQRCAGESEIEKMCATDTHNEILPSSMRKLASRIDKAYNTEGFNKAFDDEWEAMNSYTHSGLRQLARRDFGGAREGVGYSEIAIVEVLDSATWSMQCLAKIFLFSRNRCLQALSLEAAYKNYLDFHSNQKSSEALRLMSETAKADPSVFDGNTTPPATPRS